MQQAYVPQNAEMDKRQALENCPCSTKCSFEVPGTVGSVDAVLEKSWCSAFIDIAAVCGQYPQSVFSIVTALVKIFAKVLCCC